MSAQFNSNEMVEKLNSAVRESPLAAGAIGLGVLWMMFGRKRLTHMVTAPASGMASVAAGATNSAMSGLRAGTDAATGAMSTTVESVGNAFKGTRDTVAQGVDQASSSVRSAMEEVRTTGTTTITDMHRSLSGMFERQPLALGAVGLAIGAGLAAAFPATSVEQTMIGEAAAEVKKTVVDGAESITARIGEVAEAVRDEAQKQGIGL